MATLHEKEKNRNCKQFQFSYFLFEFMSTMVHNTYYKYFIAKYLTGDMLYTLNMIYNITG